MAEAVDGQSVREHYAELAATYAERANPACVAAFHSVAEKWLPRDAPILEIGCGAMPLTAERKGAVGCDYSPHMLHAGAGDMPRLCADGARLPFADGAFAGAVSINVLEHVPSPAGLIAEAARVIAPGGVFVAVTPNGNVEWLLDLIERMGMKLPEGPHAFLATSELNSIAERSFDIVAHKTFLAFPAGPPALVGAIDAIAPFGLFQYLVARKGDASTR